MAGRPSTYTDKIGAVICGRIAAGESLRRICKDDGIPSQSTVFVWLRQHEDFRQLYTLAREDQAEYWAEEILEIADDATNDFMTRTRADGSTETVVDHEHIQRSRLRVDSRKWLLSKLLPKKYGELTRLEHSGPDGGPVAIAVALEEARRRASIDVAFTPAPTNAEDAPVAETPPGKPPVAALPTPEPVDVASGRALGRGGGSAASTAAAASTGLASALGAARRREA